MLPRVITEMGDEIRSDQIGSDVLYMCMLVAVTGNNLAGPIPD